MLGERMSARSQDTLWDHDGGFGEEVTLDHFGSPERLFNCISMFLTIN